MFYLLYLNTSHSNQFSNTLSLRLSLKVTDQLAHPHKTTTKIIILYILTFVFSASKRQDKRQTFPELIYSTINFSMCAILIYYCRSKIHVFKFCHIFKEFTSSISMHANEVYLAHNKLRMFHHFPKNHNKRQLNF